MLTLDLGSALLVLLLFGGLAVAIALAILVGIVSARVFFAASRSRTDPPPAASVKPD